MKSERWLWLLTVVFMAAAIWYAPRYLAYADQPARSDVIVLFAGPDFNAREKEASKLMEEGYAQHLFIPMYVKLSTPDARAIFHEGFNNMSFVSTRYEKK